jgi:hypothetical protein
LFEKHEMKIVGPPIQIWRYKKNNLIQYVIEY